MMYIFREVAPLVINATIMGVVIMGIAFTLSIVL